MTTAANAIILQFTFPLWVALFGWMLLGERPRARDVGVFAVGAVGIALCMSEGLSLSLGGAMTSGAIGDLFAIVAGIAFASLTLCLRRSARLDDALATRANFEMLFYGNLLAAVVAAPFLASEVGRGALTVDAVLVFLWLGVFQPVSYTHLTLPTNREV